MKLEKKFSTDILNVNNLISDKGAFSSVFKVYDDNGDVYCGKFMKMPIDDFFTIGDLKSFEFSPNNIFRFENSMKYSNEIAHDVWKRFDLALKPEGVFDVRISDSKIYLPAFVNELAKDLDLETFSDLEYREFISKKKNALKTVLNDGYYMYKDVVRDENIFYSKENGIKFNDFDLWGKGGNYNFYAFPDNNTTYHFFRASLFFSENKKLELNENEVVM